MEQQVKRDRVPRPFEHFARERMFEQYVTIVRFLELAHRWEWISRTSDVPHGTFGPNNLVRPLIAVRYHIERSLLALKEHDETACRLIVRYVKQNKWDYARYGLSEEAGKALVEDGQSFLYRFLTQATVDV